MAEALLAEKAAQRSPGTVVESAGIGALVGHAADPMAQELMQERGLDLSGHRARQLSPAMAMDFDLILTMEQGHVKAIEEMSPSMLGRVHRLGRWGDFEIPDPYRKPRQAFEEALSLIDRGVADWEGRIWR